MEGKQRLYYGLGQLAYLVAKADGNIQKEEKEKLHRLIAEGILHYDPNFGITDIIFELLERSDEQAEEVFENAFKNIRSSSYYLKDHLKSEFMNMLTKIAQSFPPITDTEQYWLDRIEATLKAI